MTKTIVELILQALKLIFYLIFAYIKANDEEKIKLKDRIKLVSKLLKEATENKIEIINEQDFISNLDWETKKRYETYRDICAQILSNGGAYNELVSQDKMGMGERVARNKDVIMTILVQGMENKAKTILIAKQLALN